MMETYLRRTYGHRKCEDLKDFPFWDYRSRRGVFSCSNSSFSGSNSSCDGSSISSLSSGRSETGSENTSISDNSDTDSLMVFDQPRMTLQFLTDTSEISTMEDLYQPILNWIDPDLHLLKVTDSSECQDIRVTMPNTSTQLPSMAIMVFLHEEGMVGFQRIQSVKRNFEKAPWKFHHSEEVHRGAINPYPYNSQDFYYTSENLPLWAIRQVHYGKEHVRTVLFVSKECWETMVQFYKLMIGCEPDTKKNDFCLFTVYSHANFDVQLALKKLQSDIKPRVLENVKIQFRVNDIGNIMPLLPNVCRPLSDDRWETTDYDGNVVVMETTSTGSSNYSSSDRASVSDNGSISGRSSSIRMGSLSYKRNRLGSGQSRKSQSLRNNYLPTETNLQSNRQHVSKILTSSVRKSNKINLEQYLIKPALKVTKENGFPKRMRTQANENIQTVQCTVDESASRPKSPSDSALRKIKQDNADFQAKIEAIAKELHKKLSNLPQNEIDMNQSKVEDIVQSSDNTTCGLKSFYV